ncbi:MAG: cytochrome c oxidase assembly protein [Candidatus Velthaea sp.]|jgi:cytochrome c oxidase assembly factor CtaG
MSDDACVIALLGATAALYTAGIVAARRRGRRFGGWPIVAFAAGLALLAIALTGPADDLADRSLTWHMIQHLALVGVAAPLLLLGAPLRFALGALPAVRAAGLARALNALPLRALVHPAIAWLQFAFVLYAVHFSRLYEAALEHPPIHAFEHALFLGSALVFWTPLLAVAPAPHAPPHPVRLLALFAALPMSAFLGFVFYVTRHVLYAHYALHPGALADQMRAGAVMWICGGLPLFAALLGCIAAWGARERRLGSTG